MQNTLSLPKELQVWNDMSPMQRFEVMQIVGPYKSVTKRLRACLAHIKSNLS